MTLLKITGLTHRFEGLTAVSDFHLTVEPLELIGIIGPNGAGKTTVFNLITGVYRATEGSIQLDGREMVGLHPYVINRLGIARTFQNIRLFKDLSVLDNVRIAHYGRVTYSPIEALLHIGRFRAEERRVTEQALDLLSIFKLEDAAHERAKNLPYGMQRRLEIARALATRPKVLLLDEPAAGMNPRETEELVAIIQTLHRTRGLTIFLVEHDMRVIMKICQRIQVLDMGRILTVGSPEAVRSDPRVVEAYLGKPKQRRHAQG
jgi:branched-chain amino acid transport system ATP-binding protein